MLTENPTKSSKSLTVDLGAGATGKIDLPYEKPRFQIVRRVGMPTYAYLPDGTRVERSTLPNGVEAIFTGDLNGFVRCASYHDHFIYEIPPRVAYLYPGPAFRCTCGSFAVMAGLSGYIADASPSGKMWLCYFHAVTGQHATGGDRWV